MNFAIRAVWLARITTASAMPDEPMAEQRPIILRHEFHQFLFEFYRIGSLSEAEPVGKSRDVRVHHHTDIDTESIAEHHVCRFATDARERVEFIHRARNFATKFFHKCGAAGFNVLGLVTEKAGGLNGLLDFRQRRVGKVFGCFISLEQFRCNQIHALVSALRGKNRGDEQLQRGGKIQLTVRVGIDAFQHRKDFLRSVKLGGMAFARHENDIRTLPENKKPGRTCMGLESGKIILPAPR